LAHLNNLTSLLLLLVCAVLLPRRLNRSWRIRRCLLVLLLLLLYAVLFTKLLTSRLLIQQALLLALNFCNVPLESQHPRIST
jgi:hypothetical protein